MKKGDLRREKILDTAQELFCTKGYEETTVQDILDAMDYSKGGFYHHFESKLALLEAICEKRAAQACELAAEAAAGEGTPVEKLNRVLRASTLWKNGEGFAVLLIRIAYRKDSALMRERMKDGQLEGLQPIVENILSEGKAAGEFFTADIPATARLILRLYMQFADEIAFMMAESRKELPGEQIVVTLQTYRAALERILCAPFAPVTLFEADELKTLWLNLSKQ